MKVVGDVAGGSLDTVRRTHDGRRVPEPCHQLVQGAKMHGEKEHLNETATIWRTEQGSLNHQAR
jgi:hypothetical protein